MSRLPSLRRSTPSIRQIICPFHTLSPSLISCSSFESNKHETPVVGSFLRWISGIGVGFGLGFLYWSSSSSSTDSDSAFFDQPIMSFVDGSAASFEAAVQDRRLRSLFHKLSLPKNSPTFLLFGDVYRRKVFFNYEKRIRSRSPPEKVCGIDLSGNVVEIIFHLFDANRDGSLNLDEFVIVFHRRERDIAQPVESGIMGFLFCCGSCTYNNSPSASLRP